MTYEINIKIDSCIFNIAPLSDPIQVITVGSPDVTSVTLTNTQFNGVITGTDMDQYYAFPLYLNTYGGYKLKNVVIRNCTFYKVTGLLLAMQRSINATIVFEDNTITKKE
jgi:hypothetical protein